MSDRKGKTRTAPRPHPGPDGSLAQPASAAKARRRMRFLAATLALLGLLAAGLWWWGYFYAPVTMIARYENGQPRRVARFQRQRAFQIDDEVWGASSPASQTGLYWVPSLVLYFPEGQPSEFGRCRPIRVRTGDLVRDLPPAGVNDLAYEGLWTGLHPDGTKAFEVLYRGGQKNGPLKSWHKTGELLEAGSFRNNRKEGLWQSWHPNGKKSSECVYVDGQPHGLARTWHENGQVWQQQEYRHGVQIGKELIQDASETAESHWVEGKENGLRKVKFRDRRTECMVRDGQLHGEHREFDLSGRVLVTGQYANDQMVGSWSTFHSSGQKTWERSYRAGELHGNERRWRPDGTLESEGAYQNGKQHGRWVEYDAAGNKQVEGSFDAGRRHGTWTTYAAGKIIRQVNYEHGRVVPTVPVASRP